MSSPLPAVLAFSASDPTGGAGMQADLLTIASLGCHPLSVLTALTAQDTRGVEALHRGGARVDHAPGAHACWTTSRSPRSSSACSARRATPRPSPRSSQSIRAFRWCSIRCSPRAAAMRFRIARRCRRCASALLPLTTVLTPNSLEARRLALAAPDAELADCARALTGLGCKYVLVTGTHEPGAQVVNTLYGASGVLREDRWPRLPGEYHGSGCTLASAHRRLPRQGTGHARMPSSEAQDYTWKTLPAGFRAGPRPASARPLLRMRTMKTARPLRDHARRRGQRDALLRQGRAALEGGIAALQYRSKSRAATRERSARRSRRCAGAAACRSSSTTTSSSRSRAAPTACTWAATTATSPRRARSSAAGCSALPATTRSTAARAAVAAGADYVAFGSVFASPTKPARGARAARAVRRGAARSACRWSRSAASRWRTRRSCSRAGADALAVISDLFDAPDIAGARARLR